MKHSITRAKKGNCQGVWDSDNLFLLLDCWELCHKTFFEAKIWIIMMICKKAFSQIDIQFYLLQHNIAAVFITTCTKNSSSWHYWIQQETIVLALFCQAIQHHPNKTTRGKLFSRIIVSSSLSIANLLIQKMQDQQLTLVQRVQHHQNPGAWIVLLIREYHIKSCIFCLCDNARASMN